jgi:hypothetical protein
MTDRSNSWLQRRWIALLFVLWSLIGVGAFIMQATQNLDELALVDPYQAEIFREMPLWVWCSYAVAVLAALIGALLILLRRKGAVEASIVAVFAVIVQFGYTFLHTDIVAVRGLVAAAAFPAFILLMALLQFAYARWLAARGMLK